MPMVTEIEWIVGIATDVVVIMLLIKTEVMDYIAIRTKIMYYSYGN